MLRRQLRLPLACSRKEHSFSSYRQDWRYCDDICPALHDLPDSVCRILCGNGRIIIVVIVSLDAVAEDNDQYGINMALFQNVPFSPIQCQRIAVISARVHLHEIVFFFFSGIEVHQNIDVDFWLCKTGAMFHNGMY